jgi:UDPglucose 6-dehydrogenase
MVYVQKSTVPVGTGEAVETQFAAAGVKISYVSNPEFLREGTAISDTLYFDRVVAGSDDPYSTQAVLDLYRELEKHRDIISKKAALTPRSQQGTYVATSRNSSELIKVTANAFLALKISFANSIAKLADQAGADINEVMDGVGADRRIGRAFLNAGRGYGGGCFPKDVSGLIASGLTYGVDLDIMQAVQETNTSMPGYIVEKLKYQLNGSLKNKNVVVLGLAFKNGTSDVRKSPGVMIANLLSEHGAAVTAYDPQANDEATEDLARNITVKTSLESALSKSDAIIIATDWPEFKDEPLKTYKACAPLLVDAMNCFNPSDVKEAGITYIGVGRS